MIDVMRKKFVAKQMIVLMQGASCFGHYTPDTKTVTGIDDDFDDEPKSAKADIYCQLLVDSHPAVDVRSSIFVDDESLRGHY